MCTCFTVASPFLSIILTVRPDHGELNSIRAGGVGLNITSANHVILAEPCWNPFVEEQAIGRAYRIGQTKSVAVHKIVTLFSVEDEMIECRMRSMNEKYDNAHIVLEPCILDPVC
ncbi:hypothetical protein HYDPIDRAFT_98528 [Hydnomerulius pinastri MD-312]|uniref:Helicase C-terminal domain-containing protein n=1 Tax=Hydnomerulius pinastri MD-312 TaxID=994086 RepID=A0A0C9VRR8_9AGAM|nr:hypothetical protein HYDPIDRAFT_98528 [Hydnomerulius pinastri MD-312]